MTQPSTTFRCFDVWRDYVLAFYSTRSIELQTYPDWFTNQLFNSDNHFLTFCNFDISSRKNLRQPGDTWNLTQEAQAARLQVLVWHLQAPTGPVAGTSAQASSKTLPSSPPLHYYELPPTHVEYCRHFRIETDSDKDMTDTVQQPAPKTPKTQQQQQSKHKARAYTPNYDNTIHKAPPTSSRQASTYEASSSSYAAYAPTQGGAVAPCRDYRDDAYANPEYGLRHTTPYAEQQQPTLGYDQGYAGYPIVPPQYAQPQPHLIDLEGELMAPTNVPTWVCRQPATQAKVDTFFSHFDCQRITGHKRVNYLLKLFALGHDLLPDSRRTTITYNVETRNVDEHSSVSSTPGRAVPPALSAAEQFVLDNQKDLLDNVFHASRSFWRREDKEHDDHRSEHGSQYGGYH
ncbi:hypothetical protein JCM1840_002889 [Sporobolomyces johnsonii]